MIETYGMDRRELASVLAGLRMPQCGHTTRTDIIASDGDRFVRLHGEMA